MITRQLSMGPETGSSADWISAAVVPGAKLLPTTMKGPEAPLMDRSLPGLRIIACPWPDSRAERTRSAFGRRGFVRVARDRADATVAGEGLDCF